MKIIVEDSSFIISVFHETEPFHKEAVSLMEQILERKGAVRIIIPSVIFYETIFNLVKRGVPRNVVEDKLWKLLYIDQVFNVSLVETSAFRLFKKFPIQYLQGFGSMDYLIMSTALALDATLLTYDKGMRRNAGKIYKKIFYAAPDEEFPEDTKNFLAELKN